ncbi:MAG: thioredoxin family protein [Ruthenibacterium sp.]
MTGPVIVDFGHRGATRPDAGTCLEELAKDKPEVKVCKVNIDEEQAGRALWRDEHPTVCLGIAWKKPQRGPDAEGLPIAALGL